MLGKLLDLYAAPGSTHPVQGGAGSVVQVFLMPLPGADADASAGASADSSTAVGEPSATDSKAPLLAVVNLTASFAATHPSGLEAETLTVQSICATLHSNLPRVTEVRFLVDGQQRATLAGHADLTRTYLAADSAPSEGTKP